MVDMLLEQKSPNELAATERSSLPRATHGDPNRPLRIGGVEIPCYIVENKHRVITHRGLQRSLRRAIKGGATEMANFVEAFERKGIDCKDLIARLLDPMLFIPPNGGRPSFGYDATVLVEICEVVLEARDADLLTTRQKDLAKQCDVLMRGFARVGIISLVDEATGYQADRPPNELRRLLDLYVAKELQPWQKRFPEEFYRHIYRLKGWKYSADSSQRPQIVGKLTERLVYRRLPDGVLQELRTKNPIVYPDGSRRFRHHQFLSDDLGNPHLTTQVGIVVALLRASVSWSHFEYLFLRSIPSSDQQECFLANQDGGEAGW